MTRLSHPCEALLADYASGALPTAAGLTVSAHLDVCAECRGSVNRFAETGGALLGALPDAPLAPGALADTLARLGEPTHPVRVTAVGIPGVNLPPAVQAIGVGARRWFGRGAWAAHTNASRTDGWRSFILSLPPGGRLPAHGHGGMELTVALHGTFADDQGWHGPGDFVTAANGVEHEIVVGAESRCVCLVSTQGPLRWRNPWLGVLRPLTGI